MICAPILCLVCRYRSDYRCHLSRSLTGKIFIVPTGFTRVIVEWHTKFGIPASARIATLKCSRWASFPLSGANL
jgi:hypothetical protein